MFSLYATKNLMTGEGGFATTDDDALADRIRLYRNHGMRVRYYHDGPGHELQAHRPRRGARPCPAGAPRRAHRAAPPATPPASRAGLARLPHAAGARRPRARLAPVHDALPGRAPAGHRGPHGAGRGHAHLLPRADPPPGLPAGVLARRSGPGAAGHRPPERGGALDPRAPQPRRGGAGGGHRRRARGRHARAAPRAPA